MSTAVRKAERRAAEPLASLRSYLCHEVAESWNTGLEKKSLFCSIKDQLLTPEARFAGGNSAD